MSLHLPARLEMCAASVSCFKAALLLEEVKRSVILRLSVYQTNPFWGIANRHFPMRFGSRWLGWSMAWGTCLGTSCLTANLRWRQCVWYSIRLGSTTPSLSRCSGIFHLVSSGDDKADVVSIEILMDWLTVLYKQLCTVFMFMFMISVFHTSHMLYTTAISNMHLVGCWIFGFWNSGQFAARRFLWDANLTRKSSGRSFLQVTFPFVHVCVFFCVCEAGTCEIVVWNN